MKIFETSPLEIIISPLGKIFKIVTDYWNAEVLQRRSPANYEHAFTPLVIAALFLKWLPPVWKWIVYSLVVLFHVVAKELVHDRVVNGTFHWPNIIERIYGSILGIIVLI